MRRAQILPAMTHAEAPDCKPGRFQAPGENDGTRIFYETLY